MQSINKVLIVGYVWPEPNSSAAGRNMLSFLQLFLTQGWEVHYASPAIRTEHMADLNKQSIVEHEIALNCSSFDEFVAQLDPQVVMFDRFMMEEQFGWRVRKACPDALTILDTEDLHFLRKARQGAIKRNREPDPGELKGEQAQREVASIFRCDLTLIISDFEISLLTREFSVPSSLLHHSPFMLNTQINPEQLVPFEQRQHFISIGSFRHDPNWDAVLQLKQVHWPKIRKMLPDAQLHIYGSYPPPKATQLHNAKEGFLIKGWAESAEEVMQRSRVCLAPLRFGAGIKGKLTEAMTSGTPSVTTPIGAEGMQTDGNWPGFVVPAGQENDSEFARQAVKLYQDRKLWNSCQNYGLTLLKQKFDGQALSPKLIQRIHSIYSDLPGHRLNNFIGAMLRHHHHNSTRYFSQWIEAKNKHKPTR